MIAPIFEMSHVSPAVEAALGETLRVRAKREGLAPKPWPRTPAQCTTPPHVMERRRKVAGMLAEGLSQAEIARLLGVSPSAVSHDLVEIREGGPGMSPAEQRDKLRTIAGLDAGELEGWRAEIAHTATRPFPGEAEALIQRERHLSTGRAA